MTHAYVKLTSAEMATSWTTYQNDTLTLCLLESFLAKNEDPDIAPVLIFAQTISKDHLVFPTHLFKKERMPLPDGFSLEKDVFPNAQKIYEDSFHLAYMRQMGKVGKVTYSATLSLAVRPDLIDFYQESLKATWSIQNSYRNRYSKGITYKGA